MPETINGPVPPVDDITHYTTMVNLADSQPINTGLHSAKEPTMIAALGSPVMPLTTDDQPSHASPQVKKLLKTLLIGKHVSATGIAPAVDSLQIILNEAFGQEAANGHNLRDVLFSEDMLNVRLRKPTSGMPSKLISNHSWGTAIDLRIIHHEFPANTGDKIPRFIAVLLPFFNKAGWFSGIDFKDTMHFEVSDDTIKRWKQDGTIPA